MLLARGITAEEFIVPYVSFHLVVEQAWLVDKKGLRMGILMR